MVYSTLKYHFQVGGQVAESGPSYHQERLTTLSGSFVFKATHTSFGCYSYSLRNPGLPVLSGIQNERRLRLFHCHSVPPSIVFFHQQICLIANEIWQWANEIHWSYPAFPHPKAPACCNGGWPFEGSVTAPAGGQHLAEWERRAPK